MKIYLSVLLDLNVQLILWTEIMFRWNCGSHRIAEMGKIFCKNDKIFLKYFETAILYFAEKFSECILSILKKNVQNTWCNKIQFPRARDGQSILKILKILRNRHFVFWRNFRRMYFEYFVFWITKVFGYFVFWRKVFYPSQLLVHDRIALLYNTIL